MVERNELAQPGYADFLRDLALFFPRSGIGGFFKGRVVGIALPRVLNLWGLLKYSRGRYQLFCLAFSLFGAAYGVMHERPIPDVNPPDASTLTKLSLFQQRAFATRLPRDTSEGFIKGILCAVQLFILLNMHGPRNALSFLLCCGLVGAAMGYMNEPARAQREMRR